MSRVVLPWPPSKTSANGSQADYRGKARAAKTYKSMCAIECWAQRIRAINVSGDIAVSITYHPPRGGRIDWDNISNRAKQGFDAVAEAVGVDDGRWWPVVLRRGDKTPSGQIVIEFGGVADAQMIPIIGTIS